MTALATKTRLLRYALVLRAFVRLPWYDQALHVGAFVVVLIQPLIDWPERVLDMELSERRPVICEQCGRLHAFGYVCVRTAVRWCVDCCAWRSLTVRGNCPQGERHVTHPKMQPAVVPERRESQTLRIVR